VRKRLTRLGRGTFSSFRARNFRLFFVGQGISQVGNWLTLVAQALLVLKLTGNGFDVGILTACQFAPVLLFGAWAGLVADRADKRRLLIGVQIFAMAQSFALAALAFSGNPPVVAIYAVAVAGGIATAFDNPARRSFVVEMVEEADVQNAVSLNSALMTSSRIVGPALAGLLITTVGYGWCFLVDGLSYIAVIIGLKMMRSEQLRRSAPVARAKRQVREGLRYARRTPDLWIPLVMMTIVGTFAFNFQVVLPLFVKRTFDGTDATFTLLLSVVSVGSLIGALAMARRNEVAVRHVVVGAFAFGTAMLVFAASPTLAFAFPISMVMGFASMTFMVTSTAIVQMRADPIMRGRVLALQAIVFLGTTPIGGPIVGAICDAWGARAGLFVGGLSGVAAGIYGISASARREAREQAAAAIEAELTPDQVARERLSPTSSMSSATVPAGTPAGSSG
jgi:MFS family permease